MAGLYDLTVFQYMLTNYPSDYPWQDNVSHDSNGLSDITEAIFDNYKEGLVASTEILTPEIYLKNDRVALKFYDGSLRTKYETIFLLYDKYDPATETTETNKLALAFKIKNCNDDNELMDFTRNWIYFDFRQFTINAKFKLKGIPQYSPVHNHRTKAYSSSSSYSNTDLLNVNEIYDNIVAQLDSKTELVYPTDLSSSAETNGLPDGYHILVPGNIVSSSNNIITKYIKSDGKAIVTNSNNLGKINKEAIAKEDKPIEYDIQQFKK